MIYLTFYHARSIFRSTKLAPWVTKLFPSVKYEGTRFGMYEPTISVSLQDFEEAKDAIPTKDLIQIKGQFNIIEQLVYGVRNFDNRLLKAEVK